MSGIDHLIINSPYEEPRRHWDYNHHRMAFEIAEGRRPSGYTIASTTKKLINDPGVFVQIPLVNKIRGRVKEWRESGYAGVSGITKQLLEHWRDTEARSNRLFFCQLEAIETLIWIAEAPAAEKVGIEIPSDGGELARVCSKMATGTGKTIVMAMLIAWQSLNKINYPNKKGFAKDFLVIAPNLTVRRRLSVLLPSGEENYTDAFNVAPPGLREQLRQAKAVIRNWHALAWDTEERIEKEKDEFEIRFPNVLRIESKLKPVLKLDLNKVEPLTLNAYDTREIAELAPVIEGKHDVTRLAEIDLEKIYSQVRLQSSIFRATLDIQKQIEPDWKGDFNSLFKQLVPVVESFIESDKLQISPEMFVDDKRKRVLVRLNAAAIVNHLKPYIQKENVESYELIVDTNKPIISTGDMKAWDTSKPYDAFRKTHINLCVFDSRWEKTAAIHLDRSPHVVAWAKNDHLGFEVPYIFNGGGHKYRPDFLVKLSSDEILLIEIKGEEDQKDKTKREAMREWVRAVNQHGGFGRWHAEPAVSKRPDDVPEILERAVQRPQVR